MTGPPIQRNRGVALVSVLLIVALATTLAHQMATRHTLNIAQSRLLIDGSQARQYARGGEEYARQILYADWLEEETRANDTLLESWARGAASDEDEAEDRQKKRRRVGDWRDRSSTSDDEDRADGSQRRQRGKRGKRKEDEDATVADKAPTATHSFEIDHGTLAIRIEDLSSRFNVNAIVGTEGAANFARFQRLLDTLGMDTTIADAWRDWIDDDQDVEGLGAEDADHLLRDLPLRTADQRAIHISELLVATPISMQDFELLKPHIAALPVDYLRVNVNTASATILQALAPNVNPTDMEILVAEPREYEDVESLIAEQAPLGESVAVLAVTTEFFRIQVRARTVGARADLTSIVHRDPGSGALTLLSRNFGEAFGGTENAADAANDETGERSRQAL